MVQNLLYAWSKVVRLGFTQNKNVKSRKEKKLWKNIKKLVYYGTAVV
jgi:hypothetical protein